MHRIFFAAAAVSALLVAVPAAAQQVVPVTFATGKSSATLTGSIKGDQDRTYTVDAKAGQKMTVTLKSTKGSAEMNIFAPGNDTAISLGATDPYNVTTVLPATGRYRVQVYQMRAAARRGEVANYTLTIGITGAAAAGKPAPVKLDDLQGARAAGALDEMERRGFRNVDGFQSGANGSGTVWWNGATRQCMQLITVDGRIDSVTDIKTHPKCR
jgi:hypothetical protein